MFKFKPGQVRIRSILESIESVEAKTPDGSRRGVRHAPFFSLGLATIYFIPRALLPGYLFKLCRSGRDAGRY